MVKAHPKLKAHTLRRACTWATGTVVCSAALAGSIQLYSPGTIPAYVKLAAEFSKPPTAESRSATKQFTQAAEATFKKPNTAMSMVKNHPTGGNLTAHLARINTPVLEEMISHKGGAPQIEVQYPRIAEQKRHHLTMKFTLAVWLPPETDETGETSSGSFTDDYTVKFALQDNTGQKKTPQVQEVLLHGNGGNMVSSTSPPPKQPDPAKKTAKKSPSKVATTPGQTPARTASAEPPS